MITPDAPLQLLGQVRHPRGPDAIAAVTWSSDLDGLLHDAGLPDRNDRVAATVSAEATGRAGGVHGMCGYHTAASVVRRRGAPGPLPRC